MTALQNTDDPVQPELTTTQTVGKTGFFADEVNPGRSRERSELSDFWLIEFCGTATWASYGV